VQASVTALVVSVPVVVMLWIFFRTMTDYVVTVSIRAGSVASRTPVVGLETMEKLAGGASAGLIVLLFALAFENHRRREGTGRRLLGQIPAIAAYIMAAVVVLIAVG
jgi:hypothetical protein